MESHSHPDLVWRKLTRTAVLVPCTFMAYHGTEVVVH